MASPCPKSTSALRILTIYYAAHDQRMAMNDAYSNIFGFRSSGRAIVKFGVNASFGNRSLITKWSADLKKAFAKRVPGGRLDD